MNTLDPKENLKTRLKLNPMDFDAWIRLAKIFKAEQNWYMAEIAYVGALYNKIDDRDLVLEWLAVYQIMNYDRSRESILDSANRIGEGMREVLNSPERTMEELNFIVHCLDNPQMATESM